MGGILKTSAFGFTDDTKTQYRGNNAPTTNTANTRYRSAVRTDEPLAVSVILSLLVQWSFVEQGKAGQDHTDSDRNKGDEDGGS